MKERESSVLQSRTSCYSFCDFKVPGRMKAKGAIHGIVDWRHRVSSIGDFENWQISLVQHIKKNVIDLSASISQMLRVWYLRSLQNEPSSSESMSTWRHYAGG